jgi:hypothetical protein
VEEDHEHKEHGGDEDPDDHDPSLRVPGTVAVWGS